MDIIGDVNNAVADIKAGREALEHELRFLHIMSLGTAALCAIILLYVANGKKSK